MSKEKYCGDCFYWMQKSGKWVVLKNCSGSCDCKNEPDPGTHKTGDIEISLCTKGRLTNRRGYVFPINQSTAKAAVCYTADGPAWFFEGNQNTISDYQRLAPEWQKYASHFPSSDLVLVFGGSLMDLIGVGYLNQNPNFSDKVDLSVEPEETSSMPRTEPKSVVERSGGRKKRGQAQ